MKPSGVIINLRAGEDQRDLIDAGAAAEHKTRTEFMLHAALERAQRVLLDQTFFSLTQPQFRDFEQLLDPSPVAYDKWMSVREPWERVGNE